MLKRFVLPNSWAYSLLGPTYVGVLGRQFSALFLALFATSASAFVFPQRSLLGRVAIRSYAVEPKMVDIIAEQVNA